MKKILYSVMALAALTFSFTSLTSCEDVPAPYEIPGSGDDNPGVAGTLPYTSTSLSDWNAVTVKGAAWSLGSTYAKATGYNGSTYEATEAWLVSPVFNTGAATGAVINFDHVIRYVFNDSDLDNHELYISSDYDGDVQKATWTKLGYKPVASSTNTWDFYAANTIAVPTEYLGKDVVVAFKFVCGTSNSTTWEVKNFSVAEGTGGDQPDTPEQPGAGQPTGDGTQANPYNSVAATQYASSLAADVESDKEVYVKGKVVSVSQTYASTTYGTATFKISDDGKDENTFLVYRALYLNNAKYESGADVNVGDDVVVCGKVMNYKGNTPETVSGKAYLVSLKSNGGGSEKPDTPDTPISDALTIDGTTVTLANLAATPGTESVSLDCSTLGYTNAQDAETITFSDGTTLSFDKNGETNGAKYYDATKGFRIYKNNKLTFTGVKPIARIILTCDAYNGVEYVGNTTATVAASGNTIVYTNVFTGTSGGGTQLRIKNIKIVYAK